MRGTQGQGESIRRLDAPAKLDQQEMLDLARRATNIRRLTAIIPPATVVLSIFYLLVLSRVGSWVAMAFTTAASLGGALVLLVARRVAIRGRLMLSAWIMVGVVCALLPLFVLFFSGTALAYGVGALGLGISVAVLVLPKKSVGWAVVIAILSAIVILGLDRVVPWQRIDVSEHRLLLGISF